MNRREIIQQAVTLNRKMEVLFMPRVKSAIHMRVKAVISDLWSGGIGYATNELHKEIANPELAETIRRLYVLVGLRHARITHRRLVKDQKKGFGFNPEWTKYILDYLNRFLLQKITFDVAATTRDALLKVLAAGTIEGFSIDQMISKLEDWPFERYQAARIVRTEVNRAGNVGSKAQESTSQYEQQKEWLSVQDFRTRGHMPKDHANHVALNGTRIDANDVFTDPRNNDKLDIPGDPTASAASTVNCRCQVAFINKRDAAGELVKKRKSTTVIYPGQQRRPQTVLI